MIESDNTWLDMSSCLLHAQQYTFCNIFHNFKYSRILKSLNKIVNEEWMNWLKKFIRIERLARVTVLTKLKLNVK